MLQVESVHVHYGERPIVQNLSLTVQKGEIVSIIGPNGSGKSTLLKSISGLIPYESGGVTIDGKELQKMNVREVAKQLCMLSQSNVSPMDMTVGDLVSFGRMPHKKWYEQLTQGDREIIQWALEQTNMVKYEKRLVNSLSGGESRKAWLAMALAQRPKLLLLDEPTTYLDIAHQLDVLELVKTLNKELGITVVMVLHDLNHASLYSDKVCVIQDGERKAYGTPEDILNEELIRSVYRVEAEVELSKERKPRIHVLHKI
ncbi:ABC transporter ATP-binding protein [Paenibacillus sp. Marseille-Q4541]|uniref:ABC transporter ATP-binding protein n=1 Tax=Paenibacillus sp. Marseille-Q4541 TaxID=2831522 RepID=UPI001BA8E898|nr:ABC transporter ATP-binding protein [Paenibacillus sp. Marseille-Q4541]